ncbi:MAG TPA: HD domain-containing phosphohydrolase [Longimicrobium sp.]|nr:HD domain-containing phosphohydrolase [Longimicrobium sp.]
MPSLRTLFRGSRPAPVPAVDTSADDAADAMLEISSALMFALEKRSDELDLAGHAARVAKLADRLAANHGVSDEMRAALRQAALLHEVGMIGVPRGLLHKPEPLTAEELARVHAQAEFAAQVAAATCGHLPATLIRHQYDDEPTLRRELGEGSDAYLLTLFLRSADVADVISRAGIRPAPADQDLHRVREGDALRMEGASAEAFAAAMAA